MKKVYDCRCGHALARKEDGSLIDCFKVPQRTLGHPKIKSQYKHTNMMLKCSHCTCNNPIPNDKESTRMRYKMTNEIRSKMEVKK